MGRTTDRNGIFHLSLAAVMLGLSSAAGAHSQWEASRVDAHAPIGVMGDHTHNAGEVMLSYRYMHMEMDGNRIGTDSVSVAEALAAGPYAVVPVKMDMDMHMFGVMYAPTDRLTLMAMVPYVRLEMLHATAMGGSFVTEAEGVGDVSVGGLVRLNKTGPHLVHLNLGVSLPTGRIDERDDTPAMANAKLPYPMQLGSGTVDLKPGLTYLGQTESWSWGAQTIATIRMGENSEDYTLGDRIDATAWVAKPWTGSLSTSLRLGLANWGNIDGFDPDLNPAMIPTADPSLRGGERVDVGIGANLYGREGVLRGHRLALEVTVPVKQRLDGPQLEADWTAIAGWQYSF
ncbi:MAG: transporter [Pseudomonadota bacterium]|nr:transporter [Pseudomonadota bacterium]